MDFWRLSLQTPVRQLGSSRTRRFHGTPAAQAKSKLTSKPKVGSRSQATPLPSRTRLAKDIKTRFSGQTRTPIHRQKTLRPSEKSTERSWNGGWTNQADSSRTGASGSRRFSWDNRADKKSAQIPFKRWQEVPRRSSRGDSEYSNRVSNTISTRHKAQTEPSRLEFATPPRPGANSNPLKTFATPPLLPGLLESVHGVLGPNAQPTPIQALAMEHLIASQNTEHEGRWQETLLASETGSGKSMAYLLPVLQSLKVSETDGKSASDPHRPDFLSSSAALNPRALILAPTHELSRQLSSFAKALLHNIKLRVLCLSKANVKNAKGVLNEAAGVTASKMKAVVAASGEELVMRRDGTGKGRDVDVLVGTPLKVLEMIHGRGWDRAYKKSEEGGRDERKDRLRSLSSENIKAKDPTDETRIPEIGLANIEWVVVDEADVLFDPDFRETTLKLLSDISVARGHPILPSPQPPPTAYPFHLLLTTATIPPSLSTHLTAHHPSLNTLASPNLHRLPKKLSVSHVGWTGGNKWGDVEKSVRAVWEGDAKGSGAGAEVRRTKVLIFCNKSVRVDELSAYLVSKGIENVALSSRSELRKRGSNKHLDGFLRVSSPSGPPSSSPVHTSASEPHVLITTSLLSRGLDFDPAVKNVFIVDEPRNMVDFLHRAGRTGRAGEPGKVVVFGKMSGRGSARGKEVKKFVGGLVA